MMKTNLEKVGKLANFTELTGSKYHALLWLWTNFPLYLIPCFHLLPVLVTLSCAGNLNLIWSIVHFIRVWTMLFDLKLMFYFSILCRLSFQFICQSAHFFNCLTTTLTTVCLYKWLLAFFISFCCPSCNIHWVPWLCFPPLC